MKKLMTMGLMMAAMMMHAQTARKIEVKLTDDAQAKMTVYLPEKPTGRAVVGVPGGGYSVLSNGHEGHDWSDWYNGRGVAYAVVDYRLPHGDKTLPVGDVEKAIGIVRDSCKVWNVNPQDVGIMGFSAGGHLSSVVSTMAPYETRPNFSILFYPVISMDQKVSHKWSCINFLGEDGAKDPAQVKAYSTQNAVRRHLTPPAIILTANDDQVVPFLTNGMEYYAAMRRAGNECAVHVYPTGGHGFGIRKNYKYNAQMLSDLGNWLDNLAAPREDAVKVACIGNSITDGHGIDMAEEYGYPAQMQNMLGAGYCVKNFGVSARTMLNKGDYPYMNELAWQDAKAFRPDVVVIKLGTNDSKPYNWKHSSDFKQDLMEMIKALRPDLATANGMKAAAKAKKKAKAGKANAGEAKKPIIFICTPIPALKGDWGISDSTIVNGVIPVQQAVAKECGLEVIDLHALFPGEKDTMLWDGIHPNAKGAKRMATIIAKRVKEMTEVLAK